MNILVVHQNFPGQFPHIVSALLARGDKVAAIGGPTATARPGVDLRRWKLGRGTTPGIFEPAIRAEADLLRAGAAAEGAQQLKRDGFNPDVIIGHPGWGETLHLKMIWPDARLILFGEYWYRGVGGDADFDREFAKPDFGSAMRVNAKNATQAMAYALADTIISPTRHQRSTFPRYLADRIIVAHEGIDLDRARPLSDDRAGVTLADGRRLDRATPYITFINRTLEPLRGFHIFMRALPAFLDTCPDAHAIIIGEDRPSGYGAVAPDGRGWKAWMLAEVGEKLDLTRVHFVGRLGHSEMTAALSGGAAHIYYTYPFVLSWSLIEAMACGCMIIASDTGPVRDAIRSGLNGRLLDFFNVPALSAAMADAASNAADCDELRVAARATAVGQFGQAIGTRAWLQIIDEYRA